MIKTNQTLSAIALGAFVLFSTSCSTTKKSKVAPAAATETKKQGAEEYADISNSHGNVDEIISQMRLQLGMNIIVADNGSGFLVNELRRRNFARVSQNIITAPGVTRQQQGPSQGPKTVGPVINMSQRGEVDVVILDMVLNYADQRPLMMTSAQVLRKGNGKVFVIEPKMLAKQEGRSNQGPMELQQISSLGASVELNPFLRYMEHQKVLLIGFSSSVK